MWTYASRAQIPISNKQEKQTSNVDFGIPSREMFRRSRSVEGGKWIHAYQDTYLHLLVTLLLMAARITQLVK